VKQARQRAGDAFRQSAFLDQAKHNLRERGEPCRGAALADELSKVKRNFVKDQLIEAGKERALFWGWTNIYTYTKSIGEQVLAASGVPFTIVRPAVIESSMVYPFCGWNEGINTSAPYLYMVSKGQVQFPGSREVHLDIIPVDMVTSGMIASLVELLEGNAPAVYQYGTTTPTPAPPARYMELAGLYKRKQVFEGKKTKLFDIVSSRVESIAISQKQYDTHGARKIASAMRGLGGLLDLGAHGPMRPILKPAADALKSAAKTEDKTAEILELFLPFVAEADWIFSCENTRNAMARMPAEERARFYWEPEKIDWRSWMWDVHLPGLEKWVFPLIEERLQRELKPLRAYDTLLDMLDEMAERHDHAVALQRLEAEGFSRVTFREWSKLSSQVAAKLAALDVRPGDRVILSGLNQPAWPIAYFGVLRAGAVAVPVDPGLEGSQLTNVARSSGAKIALWDAEVEKKGGPAALAALPELRAFDLPSFVDDGFAADDTLPVPDFVAGESDLASIIYTSGTTGEPKGVMLSHGNFTALLSSLAAIFPLKESDRILSVLPLHHTFEFTCGLLLPHVARRAHHLPRRAQRRSAERGAEEGPHHRHGRRARALADAGAQDPRAREGRRPRRDDGVQLGARVQPHARQERGRERGAPLLRQRPRRPRRPARFLISGGAALPKDTAKLFNGLGLPLAEGYGLTEAAPVLTVAKASIKAKPGNVGKAIPGVELKIQNPDDKGVGEVLARGPNVMVGYEGNPEATAKTIDADGWLHTGDLGKLDDKKRLTIVGRQKDVIVTASGENVYPDDVETLLGKVDHVKELAHRRHRRRARRRARGLPRRAGNAGRSRAGRLRRHRAEPRRAARARDDGAARGLPDAAQGVQPAVVHLYDADLPRTATRKVKRSEVKAILARLVSATAPPPLDASGHEQSPVRHAIATIANKKAQEIGAGTRFKADLGFDSLMAMELSVALEAQLGRPIDNTRLAACETVAELEALVGASQHAVVETRAPSEGRRADRAARRWWQDAAKRVLSVARWASTAR
jgi:long-chain acyl-CoA synthetase